MVTKVSEPSAGYLGGTESGRNVSCDGALQSDFNARARIEEIAQRVADEIE